MSELPRVVKRLRVGILSQWFDPEPGGGAIPGALARELDRRGHDVTVVTAFPNYPTGEIYNGYRQRLRSESTDGQVRIRRVAIYPSHDGSPLRRSLNYVSFAASATTSGLTALRGLDAIWVYNSPATTSLPAAVAKYLLRVPHVLHVMDLWPDSIFETAFGGRTLRNGTSKSLLDSWCDWTYSLADSVAFVTPGVGEVLALRGVPQDKLHYIPVWADATASALAPPTLRSDLRVPDDHLLLLYAGTMGEAQGLSALIQALALVRDTTSVTCLLAGTGTAVQELTDMARTLGLGDVRFLGQLPREAMPGLMAAADVHVVALRDSALSRITMPSKIQTTLASGKPFIAAVSGDAAVAAKASEAAFVATPGDPQSIADAILLAAEATPEQLRTMGAKGRAHYESRYSLQSGVDRIESLLIVAASSSNRWKMLRPRA
jgi:glycosyltransferase involved in cell wall biosynthesis